MNSKRRIMILTVLLLMSMVAAFGVSKLDGESDQVSAAVVRASPGPSVSSRRDAATREENGRLALNQMRRDALIVGEQNPFSSKSWYVPPPSPPAVAPEKPGIPPLPFSYVGRLDDADGKWTIYLARGSQSYVVQQGDTLDNTYRIENIEGGNLVIRYLPMDSKQILQIGDAL